MGSNLVDEIDCGSFFDHIDDLIEFPLENEGAGLSSTDCKDFPTIWNDPLPDSDSLFSGSHRNSASDFSAELSVPYEDIVQLEWLSAFVEDSFSGGGLTLGKDNFPLNKETSEAKFQTSSPVSVLESSSSCSSSSCSVEKTVPLSSPCHRGPQRARSKRPRPATFNPAPAIQLISPTSSFTEIPQPFVAPKITSESENFAESPMKKILKPAVAEQKTKKKLKLSFPSSLVKTNQNPVAQTIRKCQHCEITKTPQWRAGPMGPKTLCNACGVRYKSGRLFPEYRPAASPTFVPAIHSNSHKKVIEMRTKVVPDNNATIARTAPPATVTQPEFNPSNEDSVEEENK
ncbi:GATA transcription factor 8-like [Nicotiana tomentosiformis]|uniref:GATA transcription factor 8-like n=1 Tax=Nicotiana tomentosiformis TaxID=4098 RepID=UPI00051AC5A6|nr:GATA transcription factor 8-like [Nicotiana tomentosiformis]XP_009598427.1 GATA transcription factor 8-like [Nicotiana tomentosiformis]XP_018625642.1 GATA transcription factor 8-like [Nicotiana tomentosiformis]XP_033511528.1 GATA transcription factor 8-like [Nicotiana tomentosiformis]